MVATVICYYSGDEPTVVGTAEIHLSKECDIPYVIFFIGGGVSADDPDVAELIRCELEELF